MAVMPVYGKKHFKKSSFQKSTRPILMKLGMKHQRPKPILLCSNYDHGLTLTYFTAVSNFATYIWENGTIMDPLLIIASCDLEFGFYSKLNE